MLLVRIVGKKGSKAVKGIVDNTDVRRFFGKKRPTDLLVNYGLAGIRLDQFFRKFPSARKIPTLNPHIGHGKLSAIKRASKAGILVPESKLSLSRSDSTNDWIEKLTNSIGGKGIRAARGKGKRKGRYYQKMIKNRRFEIRVHAFSWLPNDQWTVQKRVGDPDTIAWNFSQGGRFITVHTPGRFRTYTRAVEISGKILDLFNMHFGAVDFIVDSDFDVFFIEVNSAPGFTELSKPVYSNAFGSLCKMSKRELRKLI